MLAQWIDNPSAFDCLRQEWDELLSHSSSNTVFLSWEWMRTWWTHLSNHHKLAILVVREGDQLIALAPMAVARGSWRRAVPFQRMTFLGTGTVGSDYLDFIIRSGHESAALAEITKALAARKITVELGQLAPDAQALEFQPSRWTSVRTRVNACPYIDLRGHTWTSYLATLSGEHRYNVQRKLKNLAKHFGTATFEAVEDANELASALDLLISLHHKRWTEHGDSDAFHTPGHIAFHREFTARALDRGWLRLFLLRLDGKPVSALYGLRYGRTFNFYQSGFDPEFSRHSVGLVTMALAIQHAIADGAEEYDFLHGEESYKFHWAKETRELSRVELFPSGLPGQILHARSNLRSAMRAQPKINWAAGFLTPSLYPYL